MNNSSRTANTFKNMTISLILYAVSYIAVFIGRTFFIKILGNDYLSVSGLFTNVITLVSFTELGLGAASVFCLYQPIADKNYSKINLLLRFFGRLYEIVAGVTICLGLILIPFLPYLVDMDDISFSKTYLTIVYILFISNTAASYLWVQKKLFLTADQKNYIANLIQQVIHILQLVIQTVFLVITHNYIIYLILQIVCTLFTNIVTSYYVDSKYPEIRKNKTVGEITFQEKKDIAQNIASIFFYKIGAVILNGTDNIIISISIKTLFVGLCSNYVLIINAINSVIMQCFNGIGASIGNHTINASKDEQETVFRQLDIFCVFVFSFAAICLAVLLNPLIELWLGNEYVLPEITVLSLVVAFYVTGVNQIPSLYRTSLGLFKDARFYPLFAAIANIVLSIALAKIIGLSGVFWATSIVRFIFFTLVDSRLTYVKGFDKSPIKYYSVYVVRCVVLVISYSIIQYIIECIGVNGITGLFVKTIVCIGCSLIILLIAYGWTKDFRGLYQRVFGFLRTKIRKKV